MGLWHPKLDRSYEAGFEACSKTLHMIPTYLIPAPAIMQSCGSQFGEMANKIIRKKKKKRKGGDEKFIQFRSPVAEHTRKHKGTGERVTARV